MVMSFLNLDLLDYLDFLDWSVGKLHELQFSMIMSFLNLDLLDYLDFLDWSVGKLHELQCSQDLIKKIKIIKQIKVQTRYQRKFRDAGASLAAFPRGAWER